jgi:hypothetical protein
MGSSSNSNSNSSNSRSSGSGRDFLVNEKGGVLHEAP